LIDRCHFFDLEDQYPMPTDANAVKISASRGGRSKTIRDGWGSTAPIELWAIEMAMDGLVAQVCDWKRTE
jgi:hypothetical protein